MAKLSDLFPSKYLKAEVDVKDGEPVSATITGVDIEEFENNGKKEDKPVLEFAELPKPMVCNKTNAMTIASLYGDDTDDWIGKRVTLMSMEVKGPNGMVDSIVVSKRAPKPAPAKTAKVAVPTREPGEDDDEHPDF